MLKFVFDNKTASNLKKTVIPYIIVIALGAMAVSQQMEARQRKGGPHDTSQGYYKDLFMDSGIFLTSRRELPAAEALGLSMEKFVSASHKAADSTRITQVDTVLQTMLLGGYPLDENGVLLYPDGAPRFRMVYMNGGKAANHGRSLTDAARRNFQTFIRNGGSYVGSCAGAYLACKYTYIAKKDSLALRTENYRYLALWPGCTRSCQLDNSWTDVTLDKDSPLLGYYDFGGDRQVDSVRHNGGNFADTEHMWPEGTEILARYDTRGREGLSLDLTGLPVIWALKESDDSGRVISCGSHPEDVKSGERLDLMCAMVRYALDGNGSPKLKAVLEPGKERVMDRRTSDDDPAFTMIGDRQYHHFAVDVPKGCKQFTVSLKSLKGWRNFEFSLYVSDGGFAFSDAARWRSEGEGLDRQIMVDSPKPGRYYIGVCCETTVDSQETAYGTQYSGRLDVLNGVPYTILVDLKR